MTRLVHGLQIECGVVRYDRPAGEEIYQNSVDALEWGRSTQYIRGEAVHSRCSRRGRRPRSYHNIKESVSTGTDKRHLHDLGVRAQISRLDVNHQPVITLHQVMGPTLRLGRLGDA